MTKFHRRLLICSFYAFSLLLINGIFVFTYALVKIRIPPEYLSVQLTKGLDVDGWDCDLTINRPLFGNGRLTISQKLDILLHRAPGFHRQWKIDERFEFNINKPVSNNIQWLIDGELERFLDQYARDFKADFRPFSLLPESESIIINPSSESYDDENKIHRYYMGAGGTLKAFDIFQFDGTIGPIFEERRRNNQQGARLRFVFDGNAPMLGMQLKTNGWLDHLQSGNDNGFTASFNGEWHDIGAARERLFVYYNHSKQREFSLGTTELNHRRDEQLTIVNHLSSDISEPLRITWSSELTRQSTSRLGSNTRYSEFTWKNQLEFNWKRNRWHGQNYGGVDLQEQQYTGGLSQGQRTSLGFNITYNFDIADSLALETLAIRYRYDTPDESDYNDRDELRYKIHMKGGWQLLQCLGLRAHLDVDIHHLVYLYRDRSGENRWIRLFRFSVEVPWHENSIENIARFSVVSNYTDYDYQPAEDELSRVYRSFTASDTLLIKLTRNLSMEINLTGIIDDHGRFRWQDWVQDISEDGYGCNVAVIPTWDFSKFSISSGWSWHYRKTHLHLASDRTTPGESVRSDGPLLIIRTVSSRRFQGELAGSIRYVQDKQRGNYRLPDIHCRLIWALD